MRSRFGSRDVHEKTGTLYSVVEFLDIEDVTSNDRLPFILGFANTQENKQRKGEGGSIK